MNSASLCSLAGRYDNPIPLRFLAPIDCLKIPALGVGVEERRGGVEGLYCKRPIQCLASSKILTPTPHCPASVYPPAFGAGGGHTRWVERGWALGVNSSEDARHYPVLYLYVSTLSEGAFSLQCSLHSYGCTERL